MYEDIISDVLLFVEVIKVGTLSGAARKLGISKPSVSRRINQLEAKLKNPLIKRTTRQLSLTEAGRILYNQCSSIGAMLDEAVQEISEHKSHPTGKLKIGFSSYFANDINASALVAKFMRLHPDISIELHSFTTAEDVDLIEKDFDLYFTDQDLSSSKLISSLYANYTIKICASPDYISQHGEPKNIHELTQHNCLLHYLYESTIKQWAYYEKNKLKTIEVNGHFSASRAHFLLKMAVSGSGLALLPEFMIKPYLKSGELVTVLKSVKLQNASVYITQYRHKNIPKKLQLFLDYMKSQIVIKQKTTLTGGNNMLPNLYNF
ncbi:MAG: LysR family transcriptional regulator [Gammaproteobacteria bacterium]|nr:LysR family transcriptional regulator [Gammaproteobacteria bacterium]